MLQKAKKHLSKDPLFILFIPILENIEINSFENADSEVNIMTSLIKAIVSQQLSVKAADTIYKRFLGLFDGISPSATILLETDTEILKSVGLSKQKTTYIREVAFLIIP
jgi:DNA-3-methyladenine glycosylase II